jgi:hypothetical protein
MAYSCFFDIEKSKICQAAGLSGPPVCDFLINVANVAHSRLSIALPSETQTQFERVTSIRLTCLGLLKQDCVCRQASDRTVLIMLTDDAEQPKKVKWEIMSA